MSQAARLHEDQGGSQFELLPHPVITCARRHHCQTARALKSSQVDLSVGLHVVAPPQRVIIQ